jgi:hypothetical protein
MQIQYLVAARQRESNLIESYTEEEKAIRVHELSTEKLMRAEATLCTYIYPNGQLDSL